MRRELVGLMALSAREAVLRAAQDNLWRHATAGPWEPQAGIAEADEEEEEGLHGRVLACVSGGERASVTFAMLDRNGACHPLSFLYF